LCFALAHRAEGLTLIDTPGFSQSESAELQALAAGLRAHPDIEIHLVLRADRKTASNMAAIERFVHFAPTHLLFAAIDETHDHGDLQTLIRRASVPVSFLSTGPQIEDVERASTSRLADLIRSGVQASAGASA
jgi:flagellar biosynthesis protein FlhF